jgi:hypothetical protein
VLSEIMDILLHPTDIQTSVPLGKKENVYVVVDNRDNVTRRAKGQNSRYWDDCGIWAAKGGASPKSLYIEGCDGSLTSVVLKDGVFCLYRSEKGKRVYRPVAPQPPREKIIVLQRNYSMLKTDNSYKRRVSCLSRLDTTDNEPPTVALIEYTGIFPGQSVHGNAKGDGALAYQRTPGHVLDKIGELGKDKKPGQIYGDMVKSDDILAAPRDTRQIKNKLYNERRKEKMKNGVTYSNNFADHVLEATTMVQSNDFVQALLHEKTKTPSIILYNAQMMKTLTQMCINAPVPTVLGVDRTFNLGEFYVTATSFKHLHVTRKYTTDHPIMFGPVFLHGTCTTKGYHSFFSHLACELLGSDTCRMMFGTDDELALKKAIMAAFPTSALVSCTRHLRNNVEDYLKNQVGVGEKHRKQISTAIFGESGLTAADDMDILDYRIEMLQNMCEDLPVFLDYLDKRLIPLIKSNVVQPQIKSGLQRNWTNNNAESLNHVLKSKVNWKSSTLPEIIKAIEDLVVTSQTDVERAIYGAGNFVLCPGFSKYAVPINVWQAMSNSRRQKHLHNFTIDSMKQSNTATSTDGKITVLRTPGRGKKPGQTKRKRVARTVTKGLSSKRLK